MMSDVPPPSTAENRADPLPTQQVGPSAPMVESRLEPWLKRAPVLLAVLALVAAFSLWQKLINIQEALAQQSATANQQAAEALALSKQASTLAQDATARLTLAQTRLNELSAQRNQVDELLQSLTKAKDDNLIMEIDSALRAAQQQSQLSGTVQPMLVALGVAQQRIKRANVPRLVPLAMSMERDAQRIQQTRVLELPVVLSQLDQVQDTIKNLALLGDALPSDSLNAGEGQVGLSWASAVSQGQWRELLWDVWHELRSLVQISKVSSEEVLMLSPDQRELVRQQLRMHVLAARMNVVARQIDAAQDDLTRMTQLVQRHVNLKTPQSKTMMSVVESVQQSLKNHTMPSMTESFAALNTLQAGR